MRLHGESAWEYLERIPSYSRKKSSLEVVRKFLDRLGNPDRSFQILHVAGTNGKGSTCAMLTSCLTEAGYLVGTFVSPHLVDIRERFLMNGEMVSHDMFDEAFETVYAQIPEWIESGNLHPTYFEFLFYMAMVLFRRAGVSIVVLETGMGGRYDVTNVIEKPLVSVITSISIDHTAFLGDTREAIATHKAGIIKRDRPVVYDGYCEEVNPVIESYAAQTGSRCHRVKDVAYEYQKGKLKICIPYCGVDEEFMIPFSAPYQARNAALAIKALEVSELSVKPDSLKAGIRKTRWAARMEEILPGVYLDGAHNEDGIREFLKAAHMICDANSHHAVPAARSKTWLLFAVSDDKEYKEMLKRIAEALKPDICMLSSMESYRSLSMDELEKTAAAIMDERTEIRCFTQVAEAMKELLSDKSEGDVAFIAGSLYLAGEIKAVLEEKHD